MSNLTQTNQEIKTFHEESATIVYSDFKYEVKITVSGEKEALVPEAWQEKAAHLLVKKLTSGLDLYTALDAVLDDLNRGNFVKASTIVSAMKAIEQARA